MRADGRRRRRSATRIAAIGALIAATAGACSTVLDIKEETVPDPPNNEGGSDGAVDERDGAIGPDASGPDGISEVDSGELTGADGAADDGAAITADASLDGYAPPGCPGDAGCDRVVFVSSAIVTMFVVQAADAKCTALATDATALPRIKNRQFQAWATTSDGPPAMRFVHGTGKYIRPDGLVIATRWEDLVDSNLARSIFHDETGNGVGAAGHVWTGTGPNGFFSAPNCTNWTDTRLESVVGVIGSTNAAWTSFGTKEPCAKTFRLYCFEK